MASTTNLLEIKDLSIKFTTESGWLTAVDHLNLDIKKGEKLGLVGESGSGKSVTAMTIMGLLGKRRDIAIQGQIMLEGEDLLRMKQDKIEKIRGRKMSMIFQDPVESLNPVFRIGNLVAEAFMVQEKTDKKIAWERAIEQLNKVRIRDPKATARQFPHELSGGMCQRVMIALALVANPPLLIADEPTTDLDVTIQAQILALLKKLHQDLGTSVILITHDLGVVCQFCDRIAVMLNGRIVELATADSLFTNPSHPYTRGLLNSIPVLGKKGRLEPMPSIHNQEARGENICRFVHRCAISTDRCCSAAPGLREVLPNHYVACFSH
ncbi:MAG: ABC transporter ATP-binding protein [Dehalococcoidaceae bacterium]|nr:ABC transporter ATP-binding protein [Dehalococcoidaceae bacterium]